MPFQRVRDLPGPVSGRCSAAFRVARSVMLMVLLWVGLQTPMWVSAAASGPYRFSASREVLGSLAMYTVRNDESLYEIARAYKTGFSAMTAANPGVDPYVPGTGRTLLLPTSWILPDAPRSPGIVINLSEMRLYYYFPAAKQRVLVRTYPVGIGDEGSSTPIGRFRIVEKIADPVWHVPASIRREKPELPAVVPPGPDNPLGTHALRLSRRTVLIHGTDAPWGIGGKVTHGCIRLYPEDIVELFGLVPVGTRVTIVRQPVKAGVLDGRVYVEVNEDGDLRGFDYRRKAENLLRKRGLLGRVDRAALVRAAVEKRGFPEDVTGAK